MNKKDIAELKKRLSKNSCTFTKLKGCYVNADREIVTRVDETFLNLDDEELHKYLEIAKKTMSGTLGNNLLELEFPLEEEKAGGKQQFLMGIKESQLKNDDLLETFYNLIISNYEYAGNYLILLFHDAYDVITKTSDNAKLDESEEVYEYVLCAICPVVLSKPGLGYREDQHRIGSRLRDWVVGVPETGFIFPTFTERSSDIHAVMYYTKNTVEPRADFMENVLGCNSRKTATEQKEIFRNIVTQASSADEDESTDVLMEIQENLSYMLEENEAEQKEDEPFIITNMKLQEIMQDIGIPEETATKIERSYEEEFGEMLPPAEYLIDTKEIAKNEQVKKERGLVKEVFDLKQQIKEITGDGSDKESDLVVVRVKPEKVPLIATQIIDGRKCIVIPIDDNEKTLVNGVEEEIN